MITVHYNHSQREFFLQVYGHARSAPKGEDLVCCAASTLIYTAAQNALQLYEQGVLDRFPVTALDPGDAQVLAVAMPEAREKVEQMFCTIAVGFDMLARQYPEYVMFRETVNGE